MGFDRLRRRWRTYNLICNSYDEFRDSGWCRVRWSYSYDGRIAAPTSTVKTTSMWDISSITLSPIILSTWRWRIRCMLFHVYAHRRLLQIFLQTELFVNGDMSVFFEDIFNKALIKNLINSYGSGPWASLYWCDVVIGGYVKLHVSLSAYAMISLAVFALERWLAATFSNFIAPFVLSQGFFKFRLEAEQVVRAYESHVLYKQDDRPILDLVWAICIFVGREEPETRNRITWSETFVPK